MVALMMVVIVLAFLTLDLWVQWRVHGRVARTVRLPRVELAPVPATGPPPGVLLTPGHTWLRLGADGPVTVGVDPLGVALLGVPDAVALPPPGRRVEAGEVLATLQRGERRLPLRAPIGGVVAERNPALAHDGGTVGTSPWEAGWLLRLDDPAPGPALSAARLGDRARSWLRDETIRARDAVARLAAAPAPAVGATMLEGGPLAGPASDHLSDEDWEVLVEETFGPERIGRDLGDRR